MESAVILVVDDHPALRAALAGLARAAFQKWPVIECADAGAALAAARAHRTALAVVDVALPDMDGITLASQLRSIHPGTEVLVISQHPVAVYARRARTAGARAFLQKERLHHELVPAMTSALASRERDGA